MRHLYRPLPGLATERDETITQWSMRASEVQPLLHEARMMEVRPAEPTPREEDNGCACATASALQHPSFFRMARRARDLGYTVAVDESLRAPGPLPSHAARRVHELVAHLRSVGAYFSPGRRCIGLAADSAWHEAMHELVHLRFDARVRNRHTSDHSAGTAAAAAARGSGGGGGGGVARTEVCSADGSRSHGTNAAAAAAAAAATTTASASSSSSSTTSLSSAAREPLRTHYERYRQLGYGLAGRY